MRTVADKFDPPRRGGLAGRLGLHAARRTPVTRPPPEPAPGQAPDAPRPSPAPGSVQPESRRIGVATAGLSATAQEQVSQIEKKVDLLLEHGDLDPSTESAFLLRQTKVDYLPRTIGAYQSIALLGRGQAADRAETELTAQLALIEQRVDAIAETVVSDLERRLAAQGSFLRARFEEAS